MSGDIESVVREALGGLECPFVVLALSSAERYSEANTAIIKHMVNNLKVPGVYVTLNKPYKTVKRDLEKAVDMRMIIFIDGVTDTAGRPRKTDGCLFLPDMTSLTDMGIIIDQAIGSIPHESKFILFDSLSTLLIYNNTGSVAKFIHYLSGRIREWDVDGIFLSLERESDRELLSQLSLFCDKTIHFNR